MSCKRPHTVKATLTSEEYETLSALAEKAGMTKAEFIRYALIHWNESLDDLVISKNKNGGRSKKLQPVSGDSDEKRSKVIYVKVTDDEHEAIRKQADVLGTTVSAYARRVMLAGKIEKIDFDMSQVAKIYHELYREGTNLNQLMYFLNAQGLPAYNEKAVFRTLEKVYQNARKVTLFIEELEQRYFTNGGNMELTDALAEGLLRTVMKNALILHTDPANYEARAEVMWAGSLSHNGLTGCGIASGDFMSHKLEHEMGGMFDVTHGAGLAALWPSWARYVYKDCLPRFVRFARNVMGVTTDGTDEEIALKGIDAMVDFYHSIGMPASFHELGIDPTDAQIDEMARRCLEACGSALGSAKKLSLDDMIAIYHAANH